MEIRLEHVNKTYRRGNHHLLVLDDVNIDIPSGRFLSILGRSGCGKSTLLSIIAGLAEPTGGIVIYGDRKIQKLNDRQKSELRNKRIGIVTQNNRLIPYLTVRENICLPSWISNNKRREGKTEKKEFVEQIMDKVGILGLVNEYPKNLSGGEKKRAVIARALVQNPEVIIADEPTANLDQNNMEGVLKLFRELADQGKTVIIATHEKEVVSYSDQVIQLMFPTAI